MDDEILKQENILACLSPAPSNAKIIQTAYKMAMAFNGRFTALFVETPAFAHMEEDERERLRQNICLAQALGASVETVYGEDVPYQIARFARLSGVSKIVLGRSAVRKRHRLRKLTLTERLIEIAPNMDVYIIPDFLSVNYREKLQLNRFSLSVKDIGLSLLILSLSTLIAMLFSRLGFNEANIITVYILGVLITSVITNSRLCGIISTVMSVLVFNFFFTYPRCTFHAYDKSYPITFLVMFIAALITGGLAQRLKDHASRAAASAYKTKLLFDTNQLLQKAKTADQIADSAAGQLSKLLKRSTVIFLVAGTGRLSEGKAYPADGGEPMQSWPSAAAESCFNKKQKTGAYTDTFPHEKYSYYPLRIKDRVLAVAGVAAGKGPAEAFEESLISSVLGECAMALENEKNAREKRETELLAENERLRANLLRSISHDLRTPLTSISGNASNLIANEEVFDEKTRKQIYTDIYDDSMWLINLVENLLAVTRIEDGKMKLRLSDELLDEIVSEALQHINRRSAGHEISVLMPEELILVKVDARLIMQVIINLMDNAVKYTPAGSRIEIRAEKRGNKALLSISDNGEGISDADKPRIFDMFFTGNNKSADGRRSLGLGLNLCRSIINAHGGSISVEDNEPKGARFNITLPLGEVRIHE